jgi:transposase
MPASLPIAEHLTVNELRGRYLSASGGVAQIRWHAMLLKKEGYSHQQISTIIHRTPRWVANTLRRYNTLGPESLLDQRLHNHAPTSITDEQFDQLHHALQQPPEEGGIWTGVKVQRFIERTFQVKVHLATAGRYLHRLYFSQQIPRPAHQNADKLAQETLKKEG